jgi:hypothetical protein
MSRPWGTRVTGLRAELRERRDAGISMVEMSVGVLLTGVLCAVIATVSISTMRAVTDHRARTTLTADGRIVMEAFSRRTRVAIEPSNTFDDTNVARPTAVEVAKPDQLVFYAAINPRGAVTESLPTKVEYSYVAKGVGLATAWECLMEARTPGVVVAGATTWPTTGTKVTCLAHLKTAPTFTYYGTSALTSTGCPASALTNTAAGLTDKDTLDDLCAIGIAATVYDPKRPSAGKFPLSTRVALLNVINKAQG